jgi:hypothetical protein
MIAHVPQALALTLGADDAPEEGLSPCALLCSILGNAAGGDRWLSALSEATTLAQAQATTAEIRAALVSEVDLAPDVASAVVDALAEALDIARASGRAKLRARLWSIAHGEVKASPQELALAQAAARQYLAWAGGPDAEALGRAIREAEAGLARRGRG